MGLNNVKEKLKSILTGNVYIAAMIALVGAVLCLLMSTMFLAGALILKLVPLLLFVIFTVMYFVLEVIPQTAGRWYIKVLVPVVTAAVLLILLIIFD